MEVDGGAYRLVVGNFGGSRQQEKVDSSGHLCLGQFKLVMKSSFWIFL